MLGSMLSNLGSKGLLSFQAVLSEPQEIFILIRNAGPNDKVNS